MKIRDILAKNEPTLSFEVFPPKTEDKYESVEKAASEIAKLNPAFMSVTYGAGGGTSQYTVDIAASLKAKGVTPLAHLTCVSSTREKVHSVLDQLKAQGIENVLALRGDRTPTRPESPDFKHASDLTAFIKWKKPGFSVHGACYPEAHPEAAILQQDVENLRIKQANGAEHLLTQLFFDNARYYRFMNLVRKAGIQAPVQAGVMPIVSARQVQRTVALSSASLPPRFTKMISRYDGDEAALFDAGIDYAIEQLRDLIEGGADGVHLYAMNDANVAAKVYEGIKDLL